MPGTAPDKASRDQAMEAVTRFVRAFTYENIPWREAQQAGMLWAPLRKPHENALDPHWIKRGSVTDVEHPELGKSFRYATSKWIGTATGWTPGRRAPRLDEDAATVDRPMPRGAPAIDPKAIGGERRQGVVVAASRSRSTAFACSTSRGSWRRPAARGF